jgi:hypothetical protein
MSANQPQIAGRGVQGDRSNQNFRSSVEYDVNYLADDDRQQLHQTHSSGQALLSRGHQIAAPDGIDDSPALPLAPGQLQPPAMTHALASPSPAATLDLQP